MSRGLVFNVQRFSLHDGPGIRTTVFLKGCPLDCVWCHNPEGIASRPELLVLENRCIACRACVEACPRGLASPGESAAGNGCRVCGACVDACPAGARQIAGREMTVDELRETVLRDRIFFDDSGGGVTFSGGEPLAQFDFLMAALGACRSAEVHTAVDTCGMAPAERLLAVGRRASLVLFDLKMIDDASHRRFTGVSNRTILENLRALARQHDHIWLRVPLVAGINDSRENLEATARLAAGLPGVRKICLLPYHRTGAAKIRRLGRASPVESLEAPAAERVRELAASMQAVGVPTQIGG